MSSGAMTRRAACVALAGAMLVSGCGPGKVSADVILRACITLAKCGLVLDTARCTVELPFVNDPALITQQVSTTSSSLPSPQVVACVASAGADCDAATRCYLAGHTPDPCPRSGASCDGAELRECSGNTPVLSGVLDCALLGATCVSRAAGASCGYGACGSDVTPCADERGNPGGNFAQQCFFGVIQRTDCGHIGATCVPSGSLGSQCRGTGPACSRPPDGLTLRCDGTILVTCADGQETRYDCANLGLGCFINGDRSGWACARGDECDPLGSIPSCDGNTLTLCNDGKLVSFDCSSAGFGACYDLVRGGFCY